MLNRRPTYVKTWKIETIAKYAGHVTQAIQKLINKSDIKIQPAQNDIKFKN